MRVVAFSDAHIQYGATRVDKLRQFFQQLADSPPDELVMVGDVWELWRNDLSGAFVQSMELNSLLQDATEAAGKTVYVVGNHDYWLLNHTNAEHAEYAYAPRREYEANYDGTDVLFLHGDRFDSPAFNPPTNDALCLMDDNLGSLSSRIWDVLTLPVSTFNEPSLFRPLEALSDPNSIRQQPARIETMRNRINLYKNADEWAIFGHTHVPSIDSERKLLNAGAWTIDQPTYAEIIDGGVHLREF